MIKSTFDTDVGLDHTVQFEDPPLGTNGVSLSSPPASVMPPSQPAPASQPALASQPTPSGKIGLNLGFPKVVIIPHHSVHIQTASADLLHSLEYECEENQVQDEAKEWANIIALTSTIKGGGDIRIPKSYANAMKDSEDWLPAMQTKMDSLVK
ncbi:hypothetical protein GYMLUDRAFT_251319 [Collybiopsis luxurians FD-317 M1]|uniref:Uncharacterized protein n=1 Tax=Collybiopsis luxurians FD-317 M1 TaxID=944289 RepID=A0A0D0CBK5_9AGAR|nr:hypothetical protein GYMLUDRAFT_251319 [Collybiopsis luxurians FD-317 M1]